LHCCCHRLHNLCEDPKLPTKNCSISFESAFTVSEFCVTFTLCRAVDVGKVSEVIAGSHVRASKRIPTHSNFNRLKLARTHCHSASKTKSGASSHNSPLRHRISSSSWPPKAWFSPRLPTLPQDTTYPLYRAQQGCADFLFSLLSTGSSLTTMGATVDRCSSPRVAPAYQSAACCLLRDGTPGAWGEETREYPVIEG
jgi:hypothetical protein